MKSRARDAFLYKRENSKRQNTASGSMPGGRDYGGLGTTPAFAVLPGAQPMYSYKYRHPPLHSALCTRPTHSGPSGHT